jgi:uncharacterized protein (TIGR02421 family)
VNESIPPAEPGDVALGIDRALTDIDRRIGLLVNITPVNATEAWSDFERSGFSHVPMLQSRPLEFDPDLTKRHLFDLEIERVDNPSIAQLLREKRDELNREIMLLEDRDTSRFLYESIQFFGEVGDDLVALAGKILSNVAATSTEDVRVTATRFAERAQEEFEFYRRRYSTFGAGLEIRDDVPEVMVSFGRLLIGANASLRGQRVEALIQHEVGTHVVTFENARAQPLRLLSVGLPGYDETQEGLAVLAEYVTGGLDPLRLRLLAARVIAVRRLIDGADFMDIFRELHEELGFAPRVSWSVTIRVARSGGLTKDVIYLRGIVRLLEFLADRGRLDPLFLGKMSLDHVPLIEELLQGGILRPARVHPRWLELPGSEERLQRVFEGISVLELAESDSS